MCLLLPHSLGGAADSATGYGMVSAVLGEACRSFAGAGGRRVDGGARAVWGAASLGRREARLDLHTHLHLENTRASSVPLPLERQPVGHAERQPSPQVSWKWPQGAQICSVCSDVIQTWSMSSCQCFEWFEKDLRTYQRWVYEPASHHRGDGLPALVGKLSLFSVWNGFYSTDIFS